ncbi:plastocyanin/azurin family copper-binding protein [Flavobacterium sp.]
MKTFSILKRGTFLLLFLLLFIGCKKQHSKSATSYVVAEEPYLPQNHTVEIKDMLFQPAILTVHAGDTVVWVNKDMVTHDVTQTDKAWASPPLLSGASWKKVIVKTDSYYCSIHVVMKGRVIVE